MSAIVYDADIKPSFIFIHVPRTGGSTLEHISDSGRIVIDGRAVSIGHSHDTYHQLVARHPEAAAVPVYAFIREPIDRFFSAFAAINQHADTSSQPVPEEVRRDINAFTEWSLQTNLTTWTHTMPVVTMVPTHADLFDYAIYDAESLRFLRTIHANLLRTQDEPRVRQTPRELRQESFLHPHLRIALDAAYSHDRALYERLRDS